MRKMSKLQMRFFGKKGVRGKRKVRSARKGFGKREKKMYEPTDKAETADEMSTKSSSGAGSTYHIHLGA